MTDELIFYHAPNSRSAGTRVLLEELGIPYRVHALDLKAGTQRKPDYMAVNPLGKVPAIRHRGSVVTEQVAVYLYLADEFPAAGLAPPVGDPLRGPYLRWLAFYGSSFEPAMVDRAMKRDPGGAAMSPYGDPDLVLNALADQLRTGPYLLGERFTAADVLWGSALNWMIMFGLVDKRAEFEGYVKRVTERPAVKRAAELDAALAAEQETSRPVV